MKNKQIVCIDVSKNVLDVYILHLKYYFTVCNNPAGHMSKAYKNAGKDLYDCYRKNENGEWKVADALLCHVICCYNLYKKEMYPLYKPIIELLFVFIPKLNSL